MVDQPRERPPIPPWWEPYAAEFPWWQAWRGTGGLFYARKLEATPPVVVHADDPAGLREQITRAEARW